jgi:hypothetical protein
MDLKEIQSMNISADKIIPFSEGRVHIVTPEDNSECHFSISGHVHAQMTDGTIPAYAEHPVAAKVGSPGARIREIPVKVMFDQVQHNLFPRYEAWSTQVQDMPVCVGNGAIAKAVNVSTGQYHAHPCKGPSLCRLARDNALSCSISIRMPVVVDGVPLELRSSASNTLAALTSSLTELKARYGGLRHLSLKLKIWEKSTRASLYRRFGCATIELDSTSPPAEVKEGTDDRNDGWGGTLQRAWAASFVPSEAEGRPEPSLNLGIGSGGERSASRDAGPLGPRLHGVSMFAGALESAFTTANTNLQ